MEEELMGSTFSILGAKLFTIKIGKTVLKAQLSIPEKSNELILGLDLLKNFQMKINFTKPIEIFCNKSFIPSAYVTNKQNCIGINTKTALYPKQEKFLFIKKNNL